MDKEVLKNLSNEIIQTERLVLTPVSVEYVDQMFQELTDEITQYMAIYPPKSIDDEVKFVNDSLEKMKKGADLYLVILDKTTKEYLGGVGLHKIDTRTPELGIWVKKRAHGKKIGREAIAGLKKWADKNLDFDYLIYPVDKDNIPSRKIAESLDGQVQSEGTRTFPSGKVLNEVTYHIPRT